MVHQNHPPTATAHSHSCHRHHRHLVMATRADHHHRQHQPATELQPHLQLPQPPMVMPHPTTWPRCTTCSITRRWQQPRQPVELNHGKQPCQRALINRQSRHHRTQTLLNRNITINISSLIFFLYTHPKLYIKFIYFLSKNLFFVSSYSKCFWSWHEENKVI